MRGFGILGLVAATMTAGLLLLGTGCEDEKVDNCCKCTCYVVDGSVQDEIDYISHTERSCSDACSYQCGEIRGMLSREPQSVDCATVPAR